MHQAGALQQMTANGIPGDELKLLWGSHGFHKTLSSRADDDLSLIGWDLQML